jgi:outer membrane protein assembly factor BamA
MLGGPHYSSSTNFGIGLVAAGLYKTDTISQPNYVELYGDITMKLYYMIGVDGYHLLNNDSWRVEYDVSFLNNPTKFWGIGHSQCDNKANETEYKKQKMSVSVGLSHNIKKRFFLGPEVKFCHIGADDVEGPETLWQGQALHGSNLGVGFSFAYDSRDYIKNAYTGIYLKFSQMFYPAFLGNKYDFSSSEITFNWYKPVSMRTLIATQIHGMFSYGDTPWGLMPMIGNNEIMRGYYEGRYIDKCLLNFTVEARHNIYKRHSAVCWVGAGEVFSNNSHLNFKNILPNYGVGYRWEFKKRVNVRLDWGFGKKQSGVIFSINEAF